MLRGGSQVSNDPVKWCATHMNMKLPPNQLDTRLGRDGVLNLVRILFDNGGCHIQFNVSESVDYADGRTEGNRIIDKPVPRAHIALFIIDPQRLEAHIEPPVLRDVIQESGLHSGGEV